MPATPTELRITYTVPGYAGMTNTQSLLLRIDKFRPRWRTRLSVGRRCRKNDVVRTHILYNVRLTGDPDSLTFEGETE